jgi:chromosome segregation ATPase
MSNRGTADMTAAVLGKTQRSQGPPVRRYGAGAVEAANERLAEEVAARHGATLQSDAEKPSQAEIDLREELKRANEKIAKAKYHREALETILENAKSDEAAAIKARNKIKERLAAIRKRTDDKSDKLKRREAALAAKKAEMGGKPVGVKKPVNIKALRNNKL